MIAIILYFCLIISSTFAEENNTLNISFIPTFSGNKIELNKEYISKNIDYNFRSIKFYISDLELILEDNSIIKDKNKYHLIDLEALKPISIKNNKVINKIKFNIGIDSVTNVSGIMEGDLDPTIGMYWTWQSGFINIKIEGVSNKCPARKNLFQYHLGGYLYPNLSIQKLEFDVNNKDINININLEKFFTSINITETYQIMSPSLQAVKLSKLFATCFEIE